MSLDILTLMIINFMIIVLAFNNTDIKKLASYNTIILLIIIYDATTNKLIDMLALSYVLLVVILRIAFLIKNKKHL